MHICEENAQEVIVTSGKRVSRLIQPISVLLSDIFNTRVSKDHKHMSSSETCEGARADTVRGRYIKLIQ